MLYLHISLTRAITWGHPKKGATMQGLPREVLPYPYIFLVPRNKKRGIRCVLDKEKVKIVNDPHIPWKSEFNSPSFDWVGGDLFQEPPRIRNTYKYFIPQKGEGDQVISIPYHPILLREHFTPTNPNTSHSCSLATPTANKASHLT